MPCLLWFWHWILINMSLIVKIQFETFSNFVRGFPDSSVGKESTCSAGDPSSILGSGRSSGEEIARLLAPVFLGFSCGSAVKESTCNAGDLGSIPGLGRSPGEGTGYPLQCSGLENSMDCMVYGVTKSRTRLRDFCFHWCFAEPLVGHLFLPFSRKQTELRCDLKLCWTCDEPHEINRASLTLQAPRTHRLKKEEPGGGLISLPEC